MKLKKILCNLGIHKWSKMRMHLMSSSNVWDCEKYCKKCGIKKRWSKPRD